MSTDTDAATDSRAALVKATEQQPSSADEPIITAYELFDNPDMLLVPAPKDRDWMDATDLRFAYRCLPLAIANQAGWVLLNPAGFTARWNGEPLPKDTVLTFDRSPPHTSIKSHFGYGVVTFSLPYLFRTPKGINLWVKGPSNWIKDGVQALEGMVETDWSAATFTMNWKLTRPDHTVRFDKGDPICMVVPIARGLSEYLEPRLAPLRSNPELEQQYRTWEKGRSEFHKLLAGRDPDAVQRGWQKDYFHGENPGSESFPEHQTKMNVREFIRHSG